MYVAIQRAIQSRPARCSFSNTVGQLPAGIAISKVTPIAFGERPVFLPRMQEPTWRMLMLAPIPPRATINNKSRLITTSVSTIASALRTAASRLPPGVGYKRRYGLNAQSNETSLPAGTTGWGKNLPRLPRPCLNAPLAALGISQCIRCRGRISWLEVSSSILNPGLLGNSSVCQTIGRLCRARVNCTGRSGPSQLAAC